MALHDRRDLGHGDVPSGLDGQRVLTPASRIPHGTMRSYHDRSQSQFSANPCMVTPLATRAPIAPTFRSAHPSPGSSPGPCRPARPPRPATWVPAQRIHAPLRPSTRPAVTPNSAHTRIMASFKRPHVGHHVDRITQLDDRVAGQLPRPMPGDLAAAVHVNDRRARVAERSVRGGRPLARRVHGLVLKEQAAVGYLAGHPPGMNTPLQVPALAVVQTNEPPRSTKTSSLIFPSLRVPSSRPPAQYSPRIPAAQRKM